MSTYNLGTFDRIVWNFPHAGFPEEEKNEHKGPGFEWGDEFLERHTDLHKKFFSEAKSMLNEGGKVIVTHKTIEPFSLWDVPGIAASKGYFLLATYDFNVD